MQGKHNNTNAVLLDSGACDAAALQNERSAFIQSIRKESAYRSSALWHWSFSYKNPSTNDIVKAGVYREKCKVVCLYSTYYSLHSIQLMMG